VREEDVAQESCGQQRERLVPSFPTENRRATIHSHLLFDETV